jgi:hypothetical protein
MVLKDQRKVPWDVIADRLTVPIIPSAICTGTAENHLVGYKATNCFPKLYNSTLIQKIKIPRPLPQ